MKQWYLLYCKRQEQQRAKINLENQGVECYYPEIQVEKLVRGKKKLCTEPLFPSYVFVKFDPNIGPSFTALRSTRGVIDYVRCGSFPQRTDDSLIHDLKRVDEARCVVNKLPEKGSVLKVDGGLYSNIEAIYLEADGERRSFLLIDMLNKRVKISVENKNLAV